MMNSSRSDFLLLIMFISVYSFIIFGPLDIHADEFTNIAAINITKEDGTRVSIDPVYLVKDGSEVVNNTNAKENEVSLTKGENIDVSYISPCGFAESIEGLLLKGNAEMAIKSFSSTSEIETLNLTGEQLKFFENQSPQEEAVEIASIPNNVEIIDDQEGKNKLVFIVDCDEEKIYYITKFKIT